MPIKCKNVFYELPFQALKIYAENIFCFVIMLDPHKIYNINVRKCT